MTGQDNGVNINPQQCGKHEAAIASLQVSDERQWTIIDKIQNRLPVWATFVFGILTLVIGWLLASAFKGHL